MAQASRIGRPGAGRRSWRSDTGRSRDPARLRKRGLRPGERSLSSCGPTTAASKQLSYRLRAACPEAIRARFVFKQADEDYRRRVRIVEGPEEALAAGLEELGDPSDRACHYTEA